MQKLTVTFVIGANATGKSTFIKNHFSDNKAVILDVYDYQQKAYKEAGFNRQIPFGEAFKCLYKANDKLLTDIINILRQGKNIVVEQTLFKAKRRIAYTDKIRQAIENVNIHVYVMRPSDALWESYIAQRKLYGTLQSYKNIAAQIEFPNPSEGIDLIYEVADNNIQLKMDAPNYGIVAAARKELLAEAERMCKEEEKKRSKLALIESMNNRPFWHYCESCGKKAFISAKDAFDDGWDYPPQIGAFGLLGPRTCGDCRITDTLYWKVQQKSLPIVLEETLTAEELKTWQRIKNEPESLLTEE